MRRDDGVYIGVPDCQHYEAIETIGEKTCCGGKKFQAAYIRCAARGVMEAETECLFICKKYSKDFVRSMR
jgi:hypothetical protein